MSLKIRPAQSAVKGGRGRADTFSRRLNSKRSLFRRHKKAAVLSYRRHIRCNDIYVDTTATWIRPNRLKFNPRPTLCCSWTSGSQLDIGPQRADTDTSRATVRSHLAVDLKH